MEIAVESFLVKTWDEMPYLKSLNPLLFKIKLTLSLGSTLYLSLSVSVCLFLCICLFVSLGLSH